ncbi:MAG: LysM peptidoglycan-binding domain-containing protein [Steroidobacteraceae bacterium]
MSFHQEFRVGLTAGLAGLLLAAAGCASMHSKTRGPQAAPAAPVPAASASSDGATSAVAHAAGAPQDQSAAQDQGSAAAQAAPEEGSAPGAQSATPLTRDAVNPAAPLRYTVKRGDTLWGISSMFLRDPWMWPEIWYNNPQIHNPHRIYPGDVLVLAFEANGRPRIYVEHGGAARAAAEGTGEEEGEVRLEPRLRSSALEGAIPTIPYSAIAAFLSRPAIVTTREIADAPHVVAFRDKHQIAGAGEDAYIRGLDAPVGARFVVMHIGDELHDPQTGRVLGYQALYTATAQVVRPGHPATVLLINPERETIRGDCLFRDEGGAPLNFVPRAPTTSVDGRIISVVDDVNAIGQYDIVAINRGTSRGIGPGTVLAVDQAGRTATDRGPAAYSNWGRANAFDHHVQLPEERAGTLLVFKSYDDMSYALVVGASEQMQIGDIVRNP